MSKGDRTPRARDVRRRAARKAQRRARRVALRSAGAAAAAASLAVAGLTAATADHYPRPRPPHGVRVLSDIAPGDLTSFPRYLTDVRGTMFFIASDARHGWELWRSDGTPSGTALVKDIRPGRRESWPQELTAVGDELFFTAYDGVHGREMWRSDGTRSGTVLVRDIHPSDANGYYPQALSSVGDTLFFSAEDGVHGRALWKSDGTRRGTRLVKDVNASDPPRDGPSVFGYSAAVGRALYFSADDGAHGYELWRSDGTARGTVLVKDIEPGPDDSSPETMVAVGDELFFAATESHGRELWKSDGSTSGTVLVKDISPAEFGNEGGPYPRGRLGDRLVFEAKGHGNERGLWISDGTAAGTDFLHSLDGLGPGVVLGRGRDAEVFVLTRYDGLWKTDGTAPGTLLVTDLPTYNACSHVACWEAAFLTRAGGDLYFSLNNSALGIELWTSDGTARGTGPVEDLFRGEEGSYPTDLAASGGTLFFIGRDARHGEEVFAVGGPQPPLPRRCDGLKPTIVGFGRITGTPGNDVIVGSAGPDTIDGRGGHDVICAGGGWDYIDGGAGNDRELGGGGDDTFVQGPAASGSDKIRGGGGVDTADYASRTAPVRITVDSASVADDGSADEDDDVRAVEILDGGSADDVLVGGSADDTINGGDGNDMIHGGDGNDMIDGGKSNDMIGGGDGDDLLTGGDGDDWFLGGAPSDGADRFDGEGGVDLLDYSDRVTALTVTMMAEDRGNDGAPGEGDNVGASTENIRGGRAPDTVLGNRFDNAIYGGPGDDDLKGGFGSDDLYGDAGDDALDVRDNEANDRATGGPGVDTAVYDDGDVILEVP